MSKLTNIQNFVRFRMSVSVPPTSQEEVTMIYNVFKQKTERLNQLETKSSLLQPNAVPKVTQIYYRHSQGRNRLAKFDRFIDIIYDLGVPHRDTTELAASVKDQIYQFKLKNLIAEITRLKGILRLKTQDEIFNNEVTRTRHLKPFFKFPADFKKKPDPFARRSASQLTRARVDKPYFDVKSTVFKETDYSGRVFNYFDFYKNFQVHTIKYFIGEDAIGIEKGVIDENLRDKLLYGFDGFRKM